MLACDAELKCVSESREALAKSQMKVVDERCRRAQERLSRYNAIRSLKTETEQQKILSEQRLKQLREHREQMQRFAKCAHLHNRR